MNNYRNDVIENLRTVKPDETSIAMARLIREDLATLEFAVQGWKATKDSDKPLADCDDLALTITTSIGSIGELLSALLDRSNQSSVE